MADDTHDTTELDMDGLRARLMELKDRHEAIEREMEQIQSQMEPGDEQAEHAEPLVLDPDTTDELRAQVQDWKGKYQRALADYQNYQMRAAKNETEARKQGVISVATSLMPVLDNFDLALAGDPENLTAQSVLQGIVVTRDELMRALGTHGVSILDPSPGDEFSPMHHEAVMQQDHEDVPPGAVVMSLQKGYALGDRTLRPAKVSVKPNTEAVPPAPITPTDAEPDKQQDGDADADV